MARAFHLIVFALVLAVVWAFAIDAQAYVRGVNAEQSPYFWPSGCAQVTVFTNGYSGLSRDEVAKSVGAAAQTWGPSASCPTGAPPSFEIIVAMAPDDARAGAANDGRSVIVFTEAGWPYRADALALTTHSADSAGRIMDTDIEINPDVAWANLDPGAPPESHGIERFDLQTVMTHELGHFVGLAHTCFSDPGEGIDSSDIPANLTDSGGLPIPRCTDPPDGTNAAAAEAVMWFTVDSESTTKRALSPDDLQAICDMYPPGADATCPLDAPDDGCGCSATDSPADGSAVLCGAALLLRRRRRCGQSPSTRTMSAASGSRT